MEVQIEDSTQIKHIKVTLRYANNEARGLKLSNILNIKAARNEVIKRPGKP